jgi:hypothetical protein
MSQSTGCVGTSMRVLATILAVIVVMALPISLVAHNVARVAFSPEILSQNLTKGLINSGIIQRTLSERLQSAGLLNELGPGDGELGKAFSNLSPAEWETIIERLFNPEWAEREITRTLESISSWIDNDPAPLEIGIDLVPIKEAFLRGGAEELIDMVVDSWPSCTPEQIQRMQSAAMQTGEAPLLLCEPPEPFRGQLMNFLTASVIDFVHEMPSVYFLDRGQAFASPDEASALKERLRFVRAIAGASWLLPLSLFGLIMALAIRSFRALTRWWGIPLLLSGFFTFLAALLVPPLGRSILPRLFSNVEQQTRALGNLMTVILEGLAHNVSEYLVGHAFLLGGLGIVLLFVGWFLGRRNAAGSPRVDTYRLPAASSSASGPIQSHQPYSQPPPVSPLPVDSSSAVETNHTPEDFD